MLKHTLIGTALAISVVSALAAGPALPEAPRTPAPPPAQDRVGAVEAELAALHERMAAALRARIEEVHQEIQALHEDGRHEEADHLEMIAREHLEQLHQSLGMELRGGPQPDREMMEAAKELFHECVSLHDEGQFEKARDLLASALEAHIDDPRTPAVMEQFIAHLHEADRPDMAEHAEQLFQEALMHREEAHQMHRGQQELQEAHRHIMELRETGRVEEAEAIQREFEQQMQARDEARRREGDERMRARDEFARQTVETLKREMEALREAGRHEEAEQLHRRIVGLTAEMDAGFGRARSDEAYPDFQVRIHHLHVAAENLEAAGLHDQAADLHRHAAEMEHQFQQEHADHQFGPLEDALPMIMEQIEGLRAEVAELRQIVRRLQRRINAMDNQPAPPARRPGGRSAPTREPLPHVPSAHPDAPGAPVPAVPPAHEHEYE